MVCASYLEKPQHFHCSLCLIGFASVSYLPCLLTCPGSCQTAQNTFTFIPVTISVLFFSINSLIACILTTNGLCFKHLSCLGHTIPLIQTHQDWCSASVSPFRASLDPNTGLCFSVGLWVHTFSWTEKEKRSVIGGQAYSWPAGCTRLMPVRVDSLFIKTKTASPVPPSL